MTASDVAAALKAKLTPEEFAALRSYLLDSGGVVIVHAALVRAIDRAPAPSAPVAPSPETELLAADLRGGFHVDITADGWARVSLHGQDVYPSEVLAFLEGAGFEPGMVETRHAETLGHHAADIRAVVA